MPKISGVLNNCGLHVAIPSVLEQFERLAQDEHKPTDFDENYQELKDTFCEYYNLEESTTFKKLHDYISQQSFMGQQLILGPVLREFVHKQIAKTLDDGDSCSIAQLPSEEDKDNIDLVPGRFPNIELPTLVTNFLNPLGIKLENLSQSEVKNHWVDQNIKDTLPQKINAPIYNIVLFLSKNHYELEQDPDDQEQSATDSWVEFKKRIDTACETTNCQLLSAAAASQHEEALLPERTRKQINDDVTKILKELKKTVKSKFPSEAFADQASSSTSHAVAAESSSNSSMSSSSSSTAASSSTSSIPSSSSSTAASSSDFCSDPYPPFLKKFIEDYSQKLQDSAQKIAEYRQIGDDEFERRADNLKKATSTKEFREAYKAVTGNDYSEKSSPEDAKKEALLENDRQLAEKLQAEEYEGYPKSGPGK